MKPKYLVINMIISFMLGIFLLTGKAQAISIDYELTSLGGNSYRYDYTVHNDGSLGAGVALGVFDIMFDPALYNESSLTIVTPQPPASDWSEAILTSMPGVPASYYVYALSGGIADGGTVSGFAVEFNWIAGIEVPGPGAQDFEVYDINTWALLETGTTTLKVSQGTPVPEPNTMFLLGTGLLGMGYIRKIRKINIV